MIENYRPDVMDRLGVGYADLHAVNEKIIMLLDFPDSAEMGRSQEARRPMRPVIHAEAGLIARSAQKRGRQNCTTCRYQSRIPNASLHGLVGGIVGAAHEAAHRQGPNIIDIAMIDATVATDDQIALRPRRR